MFNKLLSLFKKKSPEQSILTKYRIITKDSVSRALQFKSRYGWTYVPSGTWNLIIGVNIGQDQILIDFAKKYPDINVYLKKLDKEYEEKQEKLKTVYL